MPLSRMMTVTLRSTSMVRILLMFIPSRNLKLIKFLALLADALLFCFSVWAVYLGLIINSK